MLKTDRFSCSQKSALSGTHLYTPHPSIQVNTLTLFIQDKLLCKDGLILYRAFMKASRKFSSDGVNILVGE